MNYAYMMIVDSTVRTARKISGGLRKYRKEVDHRKGVELERGGCKVVPSYGILSHVSNKCYYLALK